MSTRAKVLAESLGITIDEKYMDLAWKLTAMQIEFDGLKEQNKIMFDTLVELKHLDNHRICEELWRIDNALDKCRPIKTNNETKEEK